MLAPTSTPTPAGFWNADEKNGGERRSDAEMLENIRKKLKDGPKPWMGRFNEPLMEGLRVLSFDSGTANPASASSTATATAVLSFGVTKRLCNDFDTLHGGAQATAVDLFTSILLDLVHPVPSVTTDLHVSCIAAAPLGSEITAVCRVAKKGGTLQYASCDLYRVTGDADAVAATTTTTLSAASSSAPILVAKGLHTKYVVRKRTKGYGGEGATAAATGAPPRSRL